MTKQRIIDEQNIRINDLTKYARDLRDRHDKAISTLSEISSGLGRVKNNKWSPMFLASDELAVIAKMKLREVYL